MKKAKRERFVTKPKKGSAKSAGAKLSPFLGVTKKKSEPDNPIVKSPAMKSGGGKDAKMANGGGALRRRLEGVRI